MAELLAISALLVAQNIACNTDADKIEFLERHHQQQADDIRHQYQLAEQATQDLASRLTAFYAERMDEAEDDEVGAALKKIENVDAVADHFLGREDVLRALLE